jgi:hypothetical protein
VSSLRRSFPLGATRPVDRPDQIDKRPEAHSIILLINEIFIMSEENAARPILYPGNLVCSEADDERLDQGA